MLRYFLDQVDQASSHPLSRGISYFGLTVGDTVPENAFTNFDSLGQMLDKYNAAVRGKNLDFELDRGIVDLRDLMAHGRVSADEADETKLAIIKFDKPRQGTVRVTDCAKMTAEWFQERIDFVRAQIERVAEALNRITV